MKVAVFCNPNLFNRVDKCQRSRGNLNFHNLKIGAAGVFETLLPIQQITWRLTPGASFQPAHYAVFSSSFTLCFLDTKYYWGARRMREAEHAVRKG
jgi:hypothetical protein